MSCRLTCIHYKAQRAPNCHVADDEVSLAQRYLQVCCKLLGFGCGPLFVLTVVDKCFPSEVVPQKQWCAEHEKNNYNSG
jgi:hypothetical protein